MLGITTKQIIVADACSSRQSTERNHVDVKNIYSQANLVMSFALCLCKEKTS